MSQIAKTTSQAVDTVAQPGQDLVGTAQDRGIYQGGISKWDQEERAQLRALGGLDEASDGALDMLQQVSHRSGLDPFLKQIYLVGRKTKTGGYRGEPERWETKWTVQVGIDGFRAVTMRYAKQEGITLNIGRPIFYDQQGQQQMIWLAQWGNPAAVEITITAGDATATTVATWDEYVQTKDEYRNNQKTGVKIPNSMWEKMGPTMLAKCAEAQAHRRVCPLTAGMYEPAEMGNEPVRIESKRVTRPGMGVDAVAAALTAAPPVVDIPAPTVSQLRADNTPPPALALEDFLAAVADTADEATLREMWRMTDQLGPSMAAGQTAITDRLAEIKEAAHNAQAATDEAALDAAMEAEAGA